MLGSIEEAQGDYEVATGHYRKAVELDPENVFALNNLSYRLAVDHDKFDEALKYAQRAKEIAPDSPTIDDTLGWIYYLKGVYRMALDHLQSAASKADQSAVIHYHVAMAHLRLGNQEAAKRAIDAGLEIDPNLPEAKMAQQLYEQNQ